MEDVESRFAHILQPIRDLTKNWEVDVAAQLEEYLEELEQICITFDDGKTTMNFAEAALLIQGSACIYSKKVEYLYSLVYQALDLISNKKRNQQPTSIEADGADKDAHFPSDGKQEEFLSLDDIHTSGNVDMRKEQPNVVTIIPLTPMALVPPEEIEKKNNPLCSAKGEILGSRKDYRMNTGTPHCTGAFVLELCGFTPVLNMNNRNRDNNQESQVLNPVTRDENGIQQMETSVCEMPAARLDFSEDGGIVEQNCAVEDDDDGGGGGFLPPLEDGVADMTPAEHVQRWAAVPEAREFVLRERRPCPVETDAVKEILDPWRSLDPFQASEDKPFRKGRPFSVPRNVDDMPGKKRKRKGSLKLLDFMKWFSGTYYHGDDTAKSKKTGPTFADMEVLYWKHVKERLAAQRRLHRRTGILFSKVLEENTQNKHSGEEEHNHIEDGRNYLDHDGPGDGYSDHEDLASDAPPVLLEGIVSDPIGLQEINETLSYEELVRRNVELFIAHSQKYAQETVLSRRVRDWEETIGPQLQEQEDRGAFDIHDYGDRIVAAFGYVGEKRSFASLMKGKEAYEVCRYKLATLQLANDYTVEVSRDPDLQKGIDSMELTLLSKQRAHERFRTYTAPSLTEN
ncbi:condensin-2 complex subunit H2 isoform X2 [Protopterus annectens]|uniref:condensin-2 complex subunit H2 isoform X2 n=1 Tax=Protopterus annectens TaxID=7888 RepID=UPI001CFA4ED5|nr:condensin-2 complex subunit H2 isoform X2 [Protopterus annectens]